MRHAARAHSGPRQTGCDARSARTAAAARSAPVDRAGVGDSTAACPRWVGGVGHGGPDDDRGGRSSSSQGMCPRGPYPNPSAVSNHRKSGARCRGEWSVPRDTRALEDQSDESPAPASRDGRGRRPRQCAIRRPQQRRRRNRQRLLHRHGESSSAISDGRRCCPRSIARAAACWPPPGANNAGPIGLPLARGRERLTDRPGDLDARAHDHSWFILLVD